MSWTRQHFELIADTVNEEIDDSNERMNVCVAFANKLQDKNQFFDKERFLDSCVGIIPEETDTEPKIGDWYPKVRKGNIKK